MKSLNFWLYIFNAVLIILHEIESAYWKEWKLFKKVNQLWKEETELTFFLVIHIPFLVLFFIGIVELEQNSLLGIIITIILNIAGIAAFSIHMYFIKKGRKEFKLPISYSILSLLLSTSIAQLFIQIFKLTI